LLDVLSSMFAVVAAIEGSRWRRLARDVDAGGVLRLLVAIVTALADLTPAIDGRCCRLMRDLDLGSTVILRLGRWRCDHLATARPTVRAVPDVVRRRHANRFVDLRASMRRLPAALHGGRRGRTIRGARFATMLVALARDPVVHRWRSERTLGITAVNTAPVATGRNAVDGRRRRT
jgi:hypothetical protein